MPQNFVEAPEKKAATAWIPLVGFVMMLLIAAVSYMLAPAFHGWLVSTNFGLAGTQILPLEFPVEWTPDIIRIVVAAMLWLGLFIIVMFALLMVMGSPMQKEDVSLGSIRKEKEKELGRKIRK